MASPYYEIKEAKSLAEAQALAAQGWLLVAVLNTNGDEWMRFYLQKEKK